MRLAGIFAAFAEELIEGVEKCCQTSRGLPVKTRPAGAMKGLDYLPLTLFPVNIMQDAWNSLTIDA